LGVSRLAVRHSDSNGPVGLVNVVNGSAATVTSRHHTGHHFGSAAVVSHNGQSLVFTDNSLLSGLFSFVLNFSSPALVIFITHTCRDIIINDTVLASFAGGLRVLGFHQRLFSCFCVMFDNAGSITCYVTLGRRSDASVTRAVMCCRFTQNLSVFRHEINDSLKGPGTCNNCVNLVISSDMMS